MNAENRHHDIDPERRVLRCAVVGCGVIGPQHVRVIRAHDELELVALVDVVRSSADRLADSVVADGGPRPAVYDSLSEALSTADIDLVAVCVPSGLHTALAEEALAAGKHVIIEKPVDVDLVSARRVTDAAVGARSRGQVTSIISQHRFDPASAIVAQAIASGRFGRITSGVASVAWWRSQDYYDSGEWRGTWELDGGGAVMNQGVHTVDLLVWFLGRPVEISARAARLAHERIEVEDTAVATVLFDSGALAVIHCTTAAYPGLTARVQVHGARGSAVIDNDELHYFHAADDDPGSGGGASYGLGGQGNHAEAEIAKRDGAPGGIGAETHHTAHDRQYQNVIDAIRTGTAPLVGVQEAAIALATVRAVYISSTLGTSVQLDDVLAGHYDDLSIQIA